MFWSSYKRAFDDIQGQWPSILRALRLTWNVAKLWTVLWAVALVVQGMLPAAHVYLTKIVVDALVPAIGQLEDWSLLRPLLFYTALYGAIMFLGQLMSGFQRWIEKNQALRIDDHMNAMIQAKSAELDLSFFDSQHYYDLIHQASQDGANKPLEVLRSLGYLAQHLIALISITGLLFTYGAIIPLVLVVTVLPGIYLIARHSRSFHHWWEKRTVDRRRADYYKELLTLSEPAAEIRLFDLASHFHNRWLGVRNKLRKEELAYARRELFINVLVALITMIGIGIAGVYLLWQTLSGSATLGDLALFAQAFNQGRTILNSVLAVFTDIHRHALLLTNLFQFLALRTSIKSSSNTYSTASGHQQGISFENVTFGYPHSARKVFREFNVNFPAGQLIAIVGSNGAGKSTLAKLLCRFYDPEAGAIGIDGVDLHRFDLDELRSRVTVIFQNPIRYDMTVAENIAIGARNRQPTQKEIEDAAAAVGAAEFIKQLPQGYATLLGKRFGGEELSSGEWQRIALARAFVRNSSIVILDEPSSAMDPWKRNSWIDHLKETLSNRTVLLITHRYTTARRADLIYVLNEGRIIERGTHSQLLNNGGRYAQLWQIEKQIEQDNYQSGLVEVQAASAD